METREVSTFGQLDQCFEEFHRFQGWVYRGQVDASWGLTPKLERVPFIRELSLAIQNGRSHLNEVEAWSLSTLNSIADRFQIPRDALPPPQEFLEATGKARQKLSEVEQARNAAVLTIEQISLRYWQRFSHHYLETRPEVDWEWLAVGQHYGLMTRLLDWTANPLAATFFALSEDREAPAAIYALRCARQLDVRTALNAFKGLAIYSPPHAFDRVIRQHGHFSVSEDPCCDLSANVTDEVGLVKILVPMEVRETLLRKVISFGIDRSTLFPGLDGVATHISWCMDHLTLLANGDRSLDRSVALVNKELMVLMESAAKRVSHDPSRMTERPPNPTPAADSETAADG